MTANATVPVHHVEVLRSIRDELQWKLRESEDPKRDRDYHRQLAALDSAIAAAPQPEATQEVEEYNEFAGVVNLLLDAGIATSVAVRLARDIAALTRNPQPVDLGQFREADIARTVDFDEYKLSVMADGSVMVSQGARLVVLIDGQPGVEVTDAEWELAQVMNWLEDSVEEMPQFPITADTAEAATDSLMGFCYMLGYLRTPTVEQSERLAALRGGQPS